MHRTQKYCTRKIDRIGPFEKIIDKNPSMSYLSLSGGKCTLIRLRKESVFSSFQIVFCSFLPAYLINLTVRPPQCKNTESHRVFFLMIWTPKSHGLIYFVFVRFFLLTCNIQEYIFIFIPFIWYVIEILQLCFDFFLCYLLFFVAFVNSRAPTFETVRGIFQMQINNSSTKGNIRVCS